MNWIKLVIKGQEVNVGFDENSIHIYDAFPIKDDLKMRGYRWNPGDKSWFVAPDDLAGELEVLKNNLTPILARSIPDRTTDLSPFPHSVSVIELRSRIDRLIKEGIRGNIWIRGVIASEVKNYKWVSYFDLKDEQENSDVFFRMEIKSGQLERVNSKLKEMRVAEGLEKDLPVFCQVEVHVSLRNVVDIRLTVRDIFPEYTQAKLRSQRDVTLEKLKSEGILNNQKALELPLLVSRIGLITSEQGTSIKDIMAGLEPFQNRYLFFFLDTRMEGVQAVDSILYSIELLDKWRDGFLDAIIIARGGGSEQSLAVFNDYRICQRICQASIPVLTAIGHEKDLSAAEVCSFYTPTPSTPSGIGKYLQDRFAGLQSQLSDKISQLIQFFQLINNRETEKLTAAVQQIPSRIYQLIKFQNERYFSLVRQFEQSASFKVRDQEREINNLLTLVLNKKKIIHDDSRKNIRQITDFIIMRMMSRNQQETKQARKIMDKLDFEKRLNENRNSIDEVLNRTRNIFATGKKLMDLSGDHLNARQELVLASDPGRILNKGFTLTLDDKNRIISSLKKFEKVRSARLKFKDGISKIIRKEEK